MRSPLTRLIARPFEARVAQLLYPSGTGPEDFLQPAGEAALADPASVSWQVFRSPIAVFVGGVAAVLLELAEPAVRSGVWEHTRFREQPLERMQRTGYATMLAVYGPRSRAVAQIERINSRHALVAGVTPTGAAYRADDPELLTWVHATAVFGFLQAHRMLVGELAPAQRDAYYAEGGAIARCYGVPLPPADEAALERLFAKMRPRLEASAIVHEFLHVMLGLRVLPGPLRVLQPALIATAIACLPAWARERLRLEDARWRVAPWQAVLLRRVVAAADRVPIAQHPATLAARRLAPLKTSAAGPATGRCPPA